MPSPRPGLLAALGGVAIAASVAILTWLLLPEIAPDWVLSQSPFVVPAARAAVVKNDEAAFAERIQLWGADAIPGLCACMHHANVKVRRMACQVVAALAQKGPLDPRLSAEARLAEGDGDHQVHNYARRALHPQAGAARADQAGKPAPTKADDEDDDDDDDDDDMPAGAPGVSRATTGKHDVEQRSAAPGHGP